MSSLFEPLKIRDMELANRVCVSPMSQYAAREGYSNDWHFAHLSRFALGGAGLIFTEATAVRREARRTHGDLGLWEDAQIEPLQRITAFLKSQGAAAGVQLAHAGRKASERRPWHGETPVNEEDMRLREEAPWQALAPTAEPYGEGWPESKAMTADDIEDVIEAFGAAARRADAAGFDVIEVYAAHGFLLHQFYSPLCNTREDNWGGSYEGRARLSLEVAEAIRREWPAGKPLFFRLSAIDWVEGGWTIDDTIRLARDLKARGVDLIDCSSGGIGGPHPLPRFPLGPAFQAALAADVRTGAEMATMAVGFIWQAKVANQVIADGQADLVALARELLNDPNWTLHAAAELGVDTDHSLWKPEFGWWLNKRERVMRKLGLRD
ncbi:MAG: NADH:flavin oxidoreductase/NADH oxidase [Rhodospirillales bacterium]|nr:NADH:flavin oxidoreductase/NADH oxidase [Rhodospirillales bacterium]